MKKRLLLVATGLLAVFGAFALLHEPALPEPEPMPVPIPPEPLLLLDGEDYEAAWRQIDSLERLGLYQSAIDKVDSIYKLADAENNHPQIIKTVIFRLKNSQHIEEDLYVTTITRMQEMAEKTSEPGKQLLHSLTAQVFYAYYQNNYWRFQQRTQTVDFVPEDIRTWDLKRLSDQIIKHYLASLENPEITQRTDINTYAAILLKGNTDKQRPTLYDFIAHRAIDNLSNSGLSLPDPINAYQVEDPRWFGDIKSFLEMIIPKSDSLSAQKHAATIMQDLLRFRNTYDNKEALLDANLKRLKFAFIYSTHPEKETLYFNRLVALKKKYKGHELEARIDYLRALYFQQQGTNYDRLRGEEHRWEITRAVAICDSAASKYPESYGGKQCLSLKESMLIKSVQFDIEDSAEPNNPFRIQIQHKNVNKLYARVVKIRGDWHMNNENQYQYGKVHEELMKLKAIKSWEINIKDERDHQIHVTDAKIEGLPYGLYMVLLSTDKDFTAINESVTWGSFWSTRISYVHQKLDDKRNRFLVVDRFTGKPLPNVKARLSVQEYDYTTRKYRMDSKESYVTDANGTFTVKHTKQYRNYRVDFRLGDDRYNYSTNFYQDIPYPQHPYTISHIFTDRGIYRPGQEIHFKGVLVKADGYERKVQANHSVTVILRDVNYQQAATITLKTNEFGTYKGSFTLPAGLLNGQMSIQDGYTSKYVSVEEYKRPKFEVSFDPVEGNFQLNKEVTAVGKAKSYAGSNIDGADVTYRVVRTARYPYWCWWYWGYYPSSAQKEITYGTTKTKDDGSFEIKFIAEPDASIDKKFSPIFNYAVSADVTDINGETRSSSTYISAGYQALELGLSIDPVVNTNDTATYPLSANNLNGQPVDTKGELKIWRLEEPKQLFRKSYWQQADYHELDEAKFRSTFPNDPYADEWKESKMKKAEQVQRSSFDTKQSKRLKLEKKKSLKPGRYLAEITATDAFGTKVTSVTTFTVFSSSNTTCPQNTFFWSHQENRRADVGEKAVVWIGSAAKNARIRYDVEVRNKIVYSEWIELNNQIQKIELPIKEEHRGNVTLHFVMVNENRVYQLSPVVEVPYTNKELDITFETFRNKLIPGQEEEWRMRIKGKKGDKIVGEVLATMYDASLDAFRSNSLNMNIWPTFYGQSAWQSYDAFTSRRTQVYHEKWDTQHPMPIRTYDQLQHFNYYYINVNYWNYGLDGDDYFYAKEQYRPFRGNRFGAYRQTESDETVIDALEQQNEVTTLATGSSSLGGGRLDNNINGLVSYDFEGNAELTREEADKGGRVAGYFMPMAGEDLTGVALRKDFSETAFFFPDLQTDENGDVLIKFTIPEALTRWKFMGLAHTADLQIGTIQEEVVTQKKLMIMPNPPRFFREGDKIVFSAKLSNMAEEDMLGEAELRILDALTMKPLNAEVKNTSQRQTFAAKKGQSTVLRWSLEIPEGVSALTYQIVAKSGKYSDGEEMAIPVLSNRLLVTESLPLPIRDGGTKTFTLSKLKNNRSKSLKHHRVTLEFTSNPAWYAVQAMPYMIEYPYECAEQTFTRYYANTLGTHIMNANPKIKKVFDSWKTQSPESFLSNLEKNQELKSALLEETPWVMQAQDETERKKRIGVLFDLNRMKNEQARALRKLQKMQVSNGGWPWFEGMPDDRYITQHIVTGLGHLDNLGVRMVREDKDTWAMLNKAIGYLDARLVEDFEYAKKHDPDYLTNQHISHLQVQYLYARSYFKDVALPKKTKEAFDYYMEQAEKFWTKFNEYNEGMLALATHRYEVKALPQKIMKSLKERALHHEELGMYWKNMMNGGYYWYQAPIETEALLIEAFDEILDDQKSVEEMKIWLLKQKQTQDWKTTKATVEACYALLLRGTDLLADDRIPQITIGNVQIKPGKSSDVEPKDIRYVDTEAGTGYLKTSWSGSEITNDMGTVKITRDADQKTAAWGAMYWQYFEDMDKITPHETPLKLTKKLFLETMTDAGPVLEEITEGKKLKPGDRIKVRIELRSDRRMEYVHMKDMRAAGFEPENVISRYKWQDGLGYYEVTKDASTNFFFSNIGKGTYVFEYALRVSQEGDFSNGITTIQCMYAPEFTAHSEGIRVKVEGK